MDASELARHVNDNWTTLTGQPKEDMDEEGEFPQPVIILIDKHGIDYMDFVDAWSALREGMNS